MLLQINIYISEFSRPLFDWVLEYHLQQNQYHSPNPNKCNRNPCVNGGNCIDLVAGYKCLCRRGFTGENCQIKRKTGKITFYFSCLETESLPFIKSSWAAWYILPYKVHKFQCAQGYLLYTSTIWNTRNVIFAPKSRIVVAFLLLIYPLSCLPKCL